MSKEYNEISRQVACKQTTNKTIAFYQNLQIATLERYCELVSGRIKIMINDFSNGKGDRATKVSYNLDLKTVRILYQKAMLFVDYSFRETKIIASGEKDRNGKVPAYRASIERKAKTSNGKPMNYPWAIKIENGVATAVPGKVRGSFSEEKGSYEKRAAAEFYMTDIDFLDCFGNIWDYIQNFKRKAADRLIPQGEQKMQEITESGTYKKGLDRSAPAAKTEPQNTAKGEEPQRESQPGRQKGKTGTMDLAIVSQFTSVNGHYVAACESSKGKLNVRFKEITPELDALQKKRQKATLKVVSLNGDLYCVGIEQ